MTTTWEYTTVEVYANTTYEPERHTELARMGADGWELVGVCRVSDSGVAHLLYFKRRR